MSQKWIVDRPNRTPIFARGCILQRQDCLRVKKLYHTEFAVSKFALDDAKKTMFFSFLRPFDEVHR